MSNENKLQAGIAHALWAFYEYGLPESPSQMAARVVKFLNEEGYTKKQLKMKAERDNNAIL